MAKSNYNYEKRQRELAKKKKKEDKRLKKLEQARAEAPFDDPLLADDQNTSI